MSDISREELAAMNSEQERWEAIYDVASLPETFGDAAREYSHRVGVEVDPEWATPEGGMCNKPFCSDTEPDVARGAYDGFNAGVYWERRRVRLLAECVPSEKG